MTTTALIAQIKIASPCHARWEDMAGDECARFCAQCQKHVYNFSAMTPESIAELVKVKEGKLCGRFYRRRDGTMLTADCPVGFRRYSQRLKLLVGSAATLLMASFIARAWTSEGVEQEKGPFTEKCETALGSFTDWLGLNPRPPVMVMGSVRVVPIAPTSQPPAEVTGNPSPANP